jgi:hypothetical protein
MESSEQLEQDLTFLSTRLEDIILINDNQDIIDIAVKLRGYIDKLKQITMNKNNNPSTPVSIDKEVFRETIGWKVSQDCTLECNNYETGDEILIPDGEYCPNDWPGIVFFEEFPQIFTPFDKDGNEIYQPSYLGLKDQLKRQSASLEELYKALEDVTKALHTALQYWQVSKDGDNFLQSEFEDNNYCHVSLMNAQKVAKNSKL